MESIENFKNHKIDDMHSVVGGRDVIKSYDTDGKLFDKDIFNNEGCLTKSKLWHNDTKYVTSYSGDCKNGYNDLTDSNKAVKEMYNL